MISRRPPWAVVVSLVTGALLLAGCGQGAPPTSTEIQHITVSILPQKAFVERIGGEYVTVNVMVEPGANPATYEPKPSQIRALGQADAYFSIGVPFEEAWMERFTAANPQMLMVDTTQGIQRMPMAARHHHGEEEEPAEGEPENPDPHIWLSPRLVRVQAHTIYQGLVQLDPEHEAVYQANLESFLADIDDLDADIRATLEGVDNPKFLVLHPAWGYFARDYGLEMIPIEVGGQEPSAAELAELVSVAQEEGIRVIFAQPEFSTLAADTIADEIGGEVLLISPLAPDWLENLRRIAAAFADVLGP